jgi:hypothetical protein
MSPEPNVISLEHFPVSRGVWLNKKLYDASRLSQMIARTGKAFVPHTRRQITEDELIDIMYKAGRRLDQENIDRFRHHGVPLKYTHFESARKVRREKHQKGAVQRAQMAAKVAKLGRLLAKKLESPALRVRAHANLQRVLTKLQNTSPDALVLNMYIRETEHHQGLQFHPVRAADIPILKSIRKTLVEKLSHYTAGTVALNIMERGHIDFILETFSKTSPTMILDMLFEILT